MPAGPGELSGPRQGGAAGRRDVRAVAGRVDRQVGGALVVAGGVGGLVARGGKARLALRGHLQERLVERGLVAGGFGARGDQYLEVGLRLQPAGGHRVGGVLAGRVEEGVGESGVAVRGLVDDHVGVRGQRARLFGVQVGLRAVRGVAGGTGPAVDVDHVHRAVAGRGLRHVLPEVLRRARVQRRQRDDGDGPACPGGALGVQRREPVAGRVVRRQVARARQPGQRQAAVRASRLRRDGARVHVRGLAAERAVVGQPQDGQHAPRDVRRQQRRLGRAVHGLRGNPGRPVLPVLLRYVVLLLLHRQRGVELPGGAGGHHVHVVRVDLRADPVRGQVAGELLDAAGALPVPLGELTDREVVADAVLDRPPQLRQVPLAQHERDLLRGAGRRVPERDRPRQGRRADPGLYRDRRIGARGRDGPGGGLAGPRGEGGRDHGCAEHGRGQGRTGQAEPGTTETGKTAHAWVPLRTHWAFWHNKTDSPGMTPQLVSNCDQMPRSFSAEPYCGHPAAQRPVTTPGSRPGAGDDQPDASSRRTRAVRAGPRGASMVAAASASPRVRPWFMITTGICSFAACRTNR